MKRDIKAYRKRYWAENKEKFHKLRTKLEYRYRSLQTRCKREGRKFAISFKTYKKKIEAGCYYCSASLGNEVGGGLDRLNNDNRNYTSRNLVGACASCNKVKSNQLTPEEMKIGMAAILKYRKKNK